jgi:hypothetical protein
LSIAPSDDSLIEHVVLYRTPHSFPLDAPLDYKCMAENEDDAAEQCMNANRDGEVVWVVQTDCVDSALEDYWGVGYD